ncbi:MAG: type I DNA topoisomerase [Candidatus Moraniibacteriota bacterium]|nr:MAG: type I DNA topoisomerase [Candidatus Moranbacteria bacterium]
MKLVIVESPSKAKTIQKYLGKDFSVVASVGHIRDLPKSNKKAIDIPDGFVPHYEVSPGKEAIVATLSRLTKKAGEVYLATDPDREGEAIAWHIAQACGLKRPKRVAFHEITPAAVREGIAHPRAIDQNLRRAQEARRVLDRLVGYDLSGLIWKKLRYGLSAGRVQSPALRILVEKEREIRAFIPEDFWVITAHTRSPDNTSLDFVCTKELREEAEAKSILERAREGTWSVVDIKETEVSRAPSPPFTTSTLQQAASSRLGFSPANTMRIAQKLYEAGLITYMRTDSVTMSAEAKEAATRFIVRRFGERFSEPRTFVTKSKNAQEAHEAIRPTDVTREKAGLSSDQQKLYGLIFRRTLASQMASAKLLRTRVLANIADQSLPDFVANGSRLLFSGWLEIDPAARQDDTEIPKLSRGDALTIVSVDCEAKQTEPPRRYSEAGLVKELEKRGIGRPSTYASILKTLLDRNYAEKEGRALRATETGEAVSTFLETHFGTVVSDTFTADLEQKLDDISNGEREYEKTLKDFYTPFSKEVKSKENLEKISTLGDAPSDIRCPECDASMVKKLGKSGTFLSCSRFPECKGARLADGSEMPAEEEIGEPCPECHGKLVRKSGRYGPFVACANYPKCKFIKGSETPTTGVRCPLCNTGEMVERRGRFGTFYSCYDYPKCKNAIKAKPTGARCEFLRDGKPCGALMMEGTKTIPERCSDKTCPNHNPHLLEKKR